MSILGFNPVLYRKRSDNMEFIFRIDAAQVKGKIGRYVISITGQDFAGNNLEGFGSTITGNRITAAQIPHRQNATAWLPAPLPGNDTKHSFVIGADCNNPDANQRLANGFSVQALGEATGCLEIDFNADKTSALVNEAVGFRNTSLGGIDPLTYRWDFGPGATPPNRYYRRPPFRAVRIQRHQRSYAGGMRGYCLSNVDEIHQRGYRAPKPQCPLPTDEYAHFPHRGPTGLGGCVLERGTVRHRTRRCFGQQLYGGSGNGSQCYGSSG
jgi:hypothetical protein